MGFYIPEDYIHRSHRRENLKSYGDVIYLFTNVFAYYSLPYQISLLKPDVSSRVYGPEHLRTELLRWADEPA
jgi:hypothetical protein